MHVWFGLSIAKLIMSITWLCGNIPGILYASLYMITSKKAVNVKFSSIKQLEFDIYALQDNRKQYHTLKNRISNTEYRLCKEVSAF